MERQYDPVVVFSFSKRACVSYALVMSELDFNKEEEKKMVNQVFKNAMDSLWDDDKTLPQVDSILPLLRRGIGIHHGGLLPILKEVIEIMFGDTIGLVTQFIAYAWEMISACCMVEVWTHGSPVHISVDVTRHQ